MIKLESIRKQFSTLVDGYKLYEEVSQLIKYAPNNKHFTDGLKQVEEENEKMKVDLLKDINDFVNNKPSPNTEEFTNATYIHSIVVHFERISEKIGVEKLHRACGNFLIHQIDEIDTDLLDSLIEPIEEVKIDEVKEGETIYNDGRLLKVKKVSDKCLFCEEYTESYKGWMPCTGFDLTQSYDKKIYKRLMRYSIYKVNPYKQNKFYIF